jgi:hypothetical protein
MYAPKQQLAVAAKLRKLVEMRLSPPPFICKTSLTAAIYLGFRCLRSLHSLLRSFTDLACMQKGSNHTTYTYYIYIYKKIYVYACNHTTLRMLPCSGSHRLLSQPFKSAFLVSLSCSGSHRTICIKTNIALTFFRSSLSSDLAFSTFALIFAATDSLGSGPLSSVSEGRGSGPLSSACKG